MANFTNGGFRYVYSAVNGLPQMFVRETVTAYATALFPGDVIIQVTDGTIAVSNGTASVGQEPFGVINSVGYVLNGKRTPAVYLPAATAFTPSTVGSPTASYVEFIPAIPSLHFFEVDADDGVATTIASQIALIGENAVVNVTGSGDTTTGVSAMALDISTHAVDESLPWRIVDYVRRADNDPSVTRFKFIVTANHSGWPSAATNRVGI